MLGYALRRIVTMIPTLLVGSLITFTLCFFGPGDPLESYLGMRATEENKAQLRKELGLDRPFWVQYGEYMQKLLLKGDFGISLLQSRLPITQTLGQVLPVSAQLGLVAFLAIVIPGVIFGVIAAVYQNSTIDYFIVTTLTALHAFPVFVLAPILMIIFTLGLHVIPDPLGWGGIFSPKIILPVLSLTLPNWVGVTRLTRNGILEVLSQDYVRTARAKGLGSTLVMMRHILPNAITPVLTVSGPLLAGLIVGSLFVERIFAIPGFGNLMFTSFVSLDYPVIMANTLISAAVAMLLYLIVDMLYGVLDPRVRTSDQVRRGR